MHMQERICSVSVHFEFIHRSCPDAQTDPTLKLYEKDMALRTLTVAFAILLVVANTAYAKHHDRGYNARDYDNRVPTRGFKHGYQNFQPITLRLRTRLNGNSTIHLRRMIESKTAIKLTPKTIVSVL
ncbi:MAG: hypothetical protein GXP16_19325 [Gammaproteobacteria bacterium]|nr:hypothetical protein [Gammaproteobacteria bacterium]